MKWDVDLLSGYDVRFVEGAGVRNEPAGFFSIIAPQIWREVSRGGFDALVVHGHTPAAALIAVAAARWAGLPVFARGETHLGLRRSLLKRLVRKPLMSAFYRSLSGVLSIGSANAAFYRAIGMPEERIFFDALHGRQRSLRKRLAIVERATHRRFAQIWASPTMIRSSCTRQSCRPASIPTICCEQLPASRIEESAFMS